ncbi:PIG-L family deacetylase [Glaciibacter sp. 2TAF33]|uniref:PIG-L family deacetylase n=1 Tax=Glaciibacter sp. 2TAF33 TaxID=3233015 RepID=UPI003F93AFCD
MTLVNATDGVLAGVTSVLFAHAHPDDETLTSGGLIAELEDHGIQVTLLTASRGERGEVVPGSLPYISGADALAHERDRELAGAVSRLGITAHYWLGEAPARAAGLAPRRYRDSGMSWIAPGLAGPAADATEDSLCAAALDEVAGDVAALIAAEKPSLVISYDSEGGYGHPDHVRTREAALEAALATGTPFAELVHAPDAGVDWFELDHQRHTVEAALRCHASQLTVDGTDVVHSGGQREPIITSVGLRRVSPSR